MWRDMIDDELTQAAFVERMVEIISGAAYDWIIEARGNEGIRPIGLVLANVMLAGRGIDPHVDWFPWATARNKFEGSAAFLREVHKQHKIFIFSDKESKPFWTRMCQYRILCKGCNVRDCYVRGETSTMYYTVGP